MKVVIVGGVAGGASAAARIRRLDEHAQIIMVANTAKRIEIRYHEPGLFLILCRSGLFMWF